MGDLDVIILCGNMEYKEKSISSAENHFHHGPGNSSYVHVMGAGMKDPKGIEPPVLYYQEGSCAPLGCQNAGDYLQEVLHTIPVLRATSTLFGGGGSINWGKYINKKTFPFIVVAFGVLAYFLTGGK